MSTGCVLMFKYLFDYSNLSFVQTENSNLPKYADRKFNLVKFISDLPKYAIRKFNPI